MLSQLHIENIAVIECADIDFQTGLCVLTGETGAGKSIIIDSINMLLGSRASRDMIRNGCDKAYVSAYFSDGLTKTVQAIFEEYGLPQEEDETILIQRELSSDGRGTARVNGRPCPVSVLKTLGRELINIHGQQDNQSLLDSSCHLKYLDSFAKDGDALTAYKSAYKRLRTVKKEMAQLDQTDAEKKRRIELLQYQITEIEDANVQDGEEERLQERKHMLANAEKIADALAFLTNTLQGERSVYDLLARADGRFSELASYSTDFEQLYDRFVTAYDEITDISETIADEAESIEYNENALDAVQERLELIRTLRRKYGEDLSDYVRRAKDELEEISFSEKRLAELEKESLAAERELLSASDTLTHLRQVAAQTLKEQIVAELAFLDMPKVRFEVRIEPKKPKSDGMDAVEFLLSSNVGEDLKPLSEIASGGELSRIMLSIKNVLADADSVATLIFDEIDTGVSGRAAQKIGMKLKEMSRKKQVITITHLAQIAAYADSHYLIEKRSDDLRTYTSVRPLTKPERVEEISRILGGVEITDTVRAAAEEMLDEYAKG